MVFQINDFSSTFPLVPNFVIHLEDFLPWCIDANEFKRLSLTFIVHKYVPVENAQQRVHRDKDELKKQTYLPNFSYFWNL